MGDSISPLTLKKVTKKEGSVLIMENVFFYKSTSKDVHNPGDIGKKTFIESLIIKIDRKIENYRWLQRYCRL